MALSHRRANVVGHIVGADKPSPCSRRSSQRSPASCCPPLLRVDAKSITPTMKSRACAQAAHFTATAFGCALQIAWMCLRSTSEYPLLTKRIVSENVS